MSNKIVNICILLFFVVTIGILFYKQFNKKPPIDYDEYRKMPPLYSMDDYDDCMKESDAKYCFVDIVIDEDRKSEIWNYIEEFSSKDKHHYRHDILKYAFCLNKIRQNLTNLNEEEKILSLESNIFVNSGRFRQLGKHLEEYSFDNKDENDVKTFVTHKFKTEYGLKAHSNVNFCISGSKRDKPRFNGLSFLCICIILIIFTSIMISTIVDLHHSRQNISPVTNFCSALSLRTNLYYLMRIPTTSNQLDVINGIKVVGEAAVVIIHTTFLLMAIPSKNPFYIESKTYEPIFTILRSEIYLLQNFFAITAFLSFFPSLAQIMRGEKITGKDLRWMVLKRLVRLWPAMMFMIMIVSTILYQLTPDKPVLLDLGGFDVISCRENWWTTLIFINNFYGASTNPCLQQTWYLAAEMQLFVVEIFIILLINRFPKKIGKILVSALILGNIITALTFYKANINGVILATVEHSRTRYFSDAEYQRGHIPFYTNTQGFFIGLLCAYVQYQIREKKIDFIKNTKLCRIWYAMYIFTFLILLHNSYYAGIITPPSILFSVYSTFCKNLGAFSFVTAVIFLGNSLKPTENVFRKVPFLSGIKIIDFGLAKTYNFLNMRQFKILARLNLGVFLVHPSVGAVMMMDGSYLETYNSALDITWISIKTIIVSYLIAAVLFVLIEMPAINLFRLIIYKRSIYKGKNGKNF